MTFVRAKETFVRAKVIFARASIGLLGAPARPIGVLGLKTRVDRGGGGRGGSKNRRDFRSGAAGPIAGACLGRDGRSARVAGAGALARQGVGFRGNPWPRGPRRRRPPAPAAVMERPPPWHAASTPAITPSSTPARRRSRPKSRLPRPPWGSLAKSPPRTPL